MEIGGLFYCDLISGDDSRHAREFSGEELITTDHENGTVQHYFNFTEIERLIAGLFMIEHCNLVDPKIYWTEPFLTLPFGAKKI